MKPVITVKNLFVDYGKTNVLTDINFELAPGDFVGIAGPNGAGKSTLIKTLLELVDKSRGAIELFGVAQERFSAWDKIGYLPQKISNLNPLFPASVEEVVVLGLLARKSFPKIVTRKDRRTVEEMLRELEIFHLRERMLSELSGGQQQRVMLARTLVAKPEILVFDEPSTALDPESRNEFFALIQKLNKQGTTILLITHDTGYIGNYANKLLYIDRKVVHFGPIDEFCCFGDKAGQRFEKADGHVIWHQHN